MTIENVLTQSKELLQSRKTQIVITLAGVALASYYALPSAILTAQTQSEFETIVSSTPFYNVTLNLNIFCPTQPLGTLEYPLFDQSVESGFDFLSSTSDLAATIVLAIKNPLFSIAREAYLACYKGWFKSFATGFSDNASFFTGMISGRCIGDALFAPGRFMNTIVGKLGFRSQGKAPVKPTSNEQTLAQELAKKILELDQGEKDLGIMTDGKVIMIQNESLAQFLLLCQQQKIATKMVEMLSASPSPLLPAPNL